MYKIYSISEEIFILWDESIPCIINRIIDRFCLEGEKE